MGTVIASGVGSGLDIDGLVTKLVEAEGTPKQVALDLKETRLQARLSAYGTFRSAADQLRNALATLTDLAKFQGRRVTVGDESILAASATVASVPGSYAVEVVDLASAHKLQSGDYAGTNAPVGTGMLQIEVGGAALSLTIDDSNGTLAGIRDAINTADANPGVMATIVTGTLGSRLILTGAATGAANTIRVTQSGGDGGLAQLVYDPGVATALSEVQSASDARIRVDGIEATSTNNVFADVISGVEITARAESAPGATTTLGIAYDRDASKKSVEEAVKAYNSLVGSLRGLGRYDAATKAAGPLVGDSTLRDFMSALRREVSAPLSGQSSFGALSDLGVSFALDGTLTLDTAKLTAALDTRFDDVGKAFAAGQEGLAVRLDALLDTYVDTGGLIEARSKGLQESISDIGKAREALAERLTRVEERLRRQFSSLDILVAQLRNTGNYLTSQLASLSGGSNN